MLDSNLKWHCKFTSTPACHINLRNWPSLDVSSFLALAQIRDTNIKLFWISEFMACCNAVFDETLV
jgi:hypothetical protein